MECDVPYFEGINVDALRFAESYHFAASPRRKARQGRGGVMPCHQTGEYLKTMVTIAITLFVVGSLLGIMLLRIIR